MILRPDGAPRWLHLCAIPPLTSRITLNEYVGTLDEVTEQDEGSPSRGSEPSTATCNAPPTSWRESVHWSQVALLAR
jgi:hypothetical protein